MKGVGVTHGAGVVSRRGWSNRTPNPVTRKCRCLSSTDSHVTGLVKALDKGALYEDRRCQGARDLSQRFMAWVEGLRAGVRPSSTARVYG